MPMPTGGPERSDGAVGGGAGVRVGEVEPDASSGVVGRGRDDHRHQVAPLDQPLHHAREHLSVKLRAGPIGARSAPSEGVRLAVPAGVRAYETI